MMYFANDVIDGEDAQKWLFSNSEEGLMALEQTPDFKELIEELRRSERLW